MVCKSYEDPLPVTITTNKKKKKPEDEEKRTEKEKEEEGKSDLEAVSTAPTNDNDINNNNKENDSNKEKEEEEGNVESKDDLDSDTVMTLTTKEEGEKEDEVEEESVPVDFSGFKVVLLRKGPTIVSAATIRIFGSSFAEMPYLATAAGYRREGHARLLITSLDSMLKQLGVQWLVVPALEEAQEFWMDRFGFESFHQGEDACDVMERCLMPENSHLLRRLVGAPFPTPTGGGDGSQKNKKNNKVKVKNTTAINNGGGLKSNKQQQQTKQQQKQQSQQGGKRVRFAAGAYKESDHEDCDGTIISKLAVTSDHKKHQNVDGSKRNKLDDDDIDDEVKGGEGTIAGCGKCGAKDSPDWHLDEDDEDIIVCTGCYKAAKKAGKQPIVGKIITPKQKSSGGGGKGKYTPSISDNNDKKKKKKKKSGSGGGGRGGKENKNKERGKGTGGNGHGKNKNKKKKGKKSSKGKAPLSLSLPPPSSSSHTVCSTTVFRELQRSNRKVRLSLLSGRPILHHTDEACSAVINADSVIAGLSDRLAASVCQLRVVESQLQEKEVENTQLKEQLESVLLKMKEMEMKLYTVVDVVAMQDMVVKTDNSNNNNNSLVGEGKGGEGVIVVEEEEKSSSEGSVMETDQQRGGSSSRKQSHNNNMSSENDEDVVAAFNRLFGDDDKNTDMK